MRFTSEGNQNGHGVTLLAHTQDPGERWEQLGLGDAAVLYRRTQIVLSAARMLPAHRRLPHQSFLSGLWWKLLSIQPIKLIASLPLLCPFLRLAR